MSKDIDSGALTLLDRALNLAGTGSARTVLDDGNLTQVLEVSPIIRRSLALVGSSGIVSAVFQHTHGAGATTEQSTIDPYAPGVLAHAPYPAEVPPDQDVYLIGAEMMTAGATASNFTSGTLRIRFAAVAQAISVDENGAQITQAAQDLAMGVWDTITGGSVDVGLRENGEAYLPINLRIRRGTTFVCSTAASNAVVVQLNLIISMLPIAFGQDVSV